MLVLVDRWSRVAGDKLGRPDLEPRFNVLGKDGELPSSQREAPATACLIAGPGAESNSRKGIQRKIPKSQIKFGDHKLNFHRRGLHLAA